MDNPRIIHAPMNGRRYSVTAPITQYDYGYLLLPEGEELPATYEIDFSNDEHKGTSLTVYGGAEGAEVPEELIRTGKDVFAFYYKVGDGYGKTDYTWQIPNYCRPDRDGGTPTPSQQSSIDQLIVRSNEAVEQAEQSASAASTSAQNASADAERAEEARTDAQNYATQAEQAMDDAQTYANNASASATASANSASASAQIKADVEDLADDAQSYAESALIASQASVTARDTAQGYAQSASASAQSASGYASQADISANTASNKASEASTSASTASQKATESAQSATNASQSAQTAEQAKADSQTAQGLAESARDSAISAKNDAESAKDDAESARDEAQSIVDGISGALDDKAPVITDTASGSIASFTDGADELPLKSLVVNIDPVQDLHGYDSPWPAGGGANKWDEEWELGVWDATGAKVNNDNAIRSKGYIPVSPETEYYLYLGIRYTVGLIIRVLDSNKSFISTITFNNSRAFTIPAGGAFIVFCTYASNNITVYNNDIAINYPSTVTTYSPYENICPISGWTEVDVNHSDADMTNPTTITIDLGQTVYGGKLDVLSGELVIDRAMVDLGTIDNWRYSQGNTGAFDTIVALTPLAKSNTKCICSQYKTLAYPNQGKITNSDFCVGINKKDDGTGYTGTYVVGTLFVKDIRYSDVEVFKTAMNGVMLCYELAEPITIQLTPNQVNSLLGVNNIFADTGDTEVVYRADTKLYIEKLTQPEEDDMIADSAITSGQFFMIGNSLYRALANIASGATITVGTNAQRVSLADALNLVNT